MRGWLWLVMLALVAGKPAAAQSLLPRSFAGWQAVAGSGATKIPLEQLDPTDAALLRACHEQTAERQSYERNGETLTAIVYWMGDPSYAYSAYSFLRPVTATDFRPTPHAAIGTDHAILLVGNLLVDVTGKNLAANPKDLSALAAALKPHASDEPFPTLWQYIPNDRMVPNSDRYALDSQTLGEALGTTPREHESNHDSNKARAGAASQRNSPWPSSDWLGFDDDVEAEVARYTVRGREMTLLLAEYPTQQLAAEHLTRMARQLNLNPQQNAGATGRPPVYARRLGSYVVMVSGATSEDGAMSLLGQIRYQTEVTWNEPGFVLKDLTMPQYIIGIVLGTLSIIGITLVVGIALGMIRIATKHYLPGVIFDRHRSVEILQLGLLSKPIDGRDFYY